MLQCQRSSLWKWIKLKRHALMWLNSASVHSSIQPLLYFSPHVGNANCGNVGTVRHGGGRDLSAFHVWVNENTLTSSHHEQRFLEVFCFLKDQIDIKTMQLCRRMAVPVEVYSLPTWMWNQQYHWSKWWRCRKLRPAPSPLVSAALPLNCKQTHRWGNTSW